MGLSRPNRARKQLLFVTPCHNLCSAHWIKSPRAGNKFSIFGDQACTAGARSLAGSRQALDPSPAGRQALNVSPGSR